MVEGAFYTAGAVKDTSKLPLFSTLRGHQILKSGKHADFAALSNWRALCLFLVFF